MKKAIVVIIWGIAFGFVEASVVEYLRAIYYPISTGGFDFPVQTIAEIRNMGPEHFRRLEIEIVREFFTLVMLGAIAIAAARNRREALAYFMIAFGVWDLFYYLGLKVFLNWPKSLATWDLLFLLPVPWVAPVMAPVIISIGLIISGLIALGFEDKGQPLLMPWRDWILIALGGFIVIVSFCWDYKNIMAGGFPNPFHWKTFLAGLALSTVTFLSAIRRRLQ